MQVWLHPRIFHHKMSDGMLSAFLAECGTSSLSPGHSQVLSCSHGEKSVEGLVPLLHHEHHNDGNISTQYVVSTVSNQTVKFA